MKSKRLKKVKFFKGADGQWRWSLVAGNGRKLCTPGEGFSSLTAAENNLRLVRTTLFEWWYVEYEK
jgi:uncharacterized protein YegP (UPF0339 family)